MCSHFCDFFHLISWTIIFPKIGVCVCVHVSSCFFREKALPRARNTYFFTPQKIWMKLDTSAWWWCWNWHFLHSIFREIATCINNMFRLNSTRVKNNIILGDRFIGTKWNFSLSCNVFKAGSAGFGDNKRINNDWVREKNERTVHWSTTEH